MEISLINQRADIFLNRDMKKDFDIYISCCMDTVRAIPFKNLREGRVEDFL